MKVLLLESDVGVGDHAADELERAGHVVLRCDSKVSGVPCRGLEPAGECPLDHEVSVAVVAGDTTELRPGEHGALCAARQRIPIVVATQFVPAGVFSSLATAAGTDLVSAVEVAAASGAQHASAVRRALLSLGVVSRGDLEGDVPAVAVDVQREGKRLVMTLWLAEGEPRASEIVKASTEALRRYDPHADVIDVRVRTSSFARPG